MQGKAKKSEDKNIGKIVTTMICFGTPNTYNSKPTENKYIESLNPEQVVEKLPGEGDEE